MPRMVGTTRIGEIKSVPTPTHPKFMTSYAFKWRGIAARVLTQINPERGREAL